MILFSPLSQHVSQLTPGDQTPGGGNDGFAASLLRYLYETKAVSDTEDQVAVLAHITELLAAPSTPEGTALQAALQSYNLPVVWSTSYRDAALSPFAIVLVQADLLTPQRYQPSFLTGDQRSDHFMLWLPLWAGHDNWFNDPLVATMQDVRYDLFSVAYAFLGAFLLPALPEMEQPPLTTGPVFSAANLRVQPHDGAATLQVIPMGAEVRLLPDATTDWQRVSYGGMTGYILSATLRPAAPPEPVAEPPVDVPEPVAEPEPAAEAAAVVEPVAVVPEPAPEPVAEPVAEPPAVTPEPLPETVDATSETPVVASEIPDVAAETPV